MAIVSLSHALGETTSPNARICDLDLFFDVQGWWQVDVETRTGRAFTYRASTYHQRCLIRGREDERGAKVTAEMALERIHQLVRDEE
jgi:hypothetical protein